MPKTIFIGCASEERPKSIAKKLRPAGQYDQRLQARPQEGRPCAVAPTPVVRGGRVGQGAPASPPADCNGAGDNGLEVDQPVRIWSVLAPEVSPALRR